MKKKILLILVIVCIAATTQAGENKPVLSGRIKLFTSLFTADNPQGTFFSHQAGDFASKRLEARLKLSGSLGERLTYNFRLDTYAYAGEQLSRGNFPEASFLGTPLSSENFELNLYEANIKVSRFLLKGLDLTIGKQRISWGSADKVSVVDLLNPLDFANFFSFDPDYFAEKRPQTALNFEYYLGRRSKLQLVWLLQHQIAPLPFGYTFLTRQSGQFQDIDVEKGWDNTVGDTNLGLRFTTNLLDTDIGISYYHGNAPLPVLREILVLSQSVATFYYPNLDVLAIDLAGEIKGVGFWAEAALHFPDKVEAVIRVPLVIENEPRLIETRFPLFGENYFKTVLGLDYHFGRGWYANLQYIHGFFDETVHSPEAKAAFKFRKGMFFGEPGDYLMGRVEHRSRRGNLQLKAGGLAELSGKKTVFLFIPEMELRVADGLIIQAGGMVPFTGSEWQLTKFGVFKKDPLLFLGMKIDF